MDAAPPRPNDPPVEAPPGWTLDSDAPCLRRQLTLQNFGEALSLLNRIADVAEQHDHHPDLHLEGWKHLRIETWSHDVGRLTARDVRLATAINDLLDSAID